MKKITAITAAAIILLTFAICIIKTAGMKNQDNCKTAESAANQAVGEDNGYDAASDTEASEEKSVSLSAFADNADGRKLVKSVDLTAETLTFDKAVSSLRSETQKLGGYIESSNITGNSYEGNILRSAYFEIRIPSEKTDSFTDKVSEIYNITERNESISDRTENYIDTESHLKALRAEEKSLLTLLEKAEKTEDIIALQSKLTDVIYEIEGYEKTLKSIDDSVAYSRITINIYEVERETPSAAAERSWGEKISDSFKNALSELGESIKSFCIVFAGMLPSLILTAVIAALLLTILSAVIKKLRKKRGQKNEPAEAEDDSCPNDQEKEDDIFADR